MSSASLGPQNSYTGPSDNILIKAKQAAEPGTCTRLAS